MARISAEAVQQAVDRMKREFQPIAIYHFGSSSRGIDGPSSDIDLLVVVEKSDEPFFARTQRAFSCLRGVEAPVDVFVYTREEFDQRAELPVSFERTVQNEGRIVYAA